MTRDTIDEWVATADRRGRLAGHVLAPPSAAKTVRVRDGETLVTDGPFAETKEFVAGFDLVECDDVDVALDLAATHPVARFGAVEIRPYPKDYTIGADVIARLREDRPRGQRYLLTVCVDGVPGAPGEDDAIMAEGRAWAADLDRTGHQLFGNALTPIEMSTTVRVRGGETLVTDGPFAETKEFIGGHDVLDAADLDEAISFAARHPVARYHCVEVRPFAVG